MRTMRAEKALFGLQRMSQLQGGSQALNYYIAVALEYRGYTLEPRLMELLHWCCNPSSQTTDSPACSPNQRDIANHAQPARATD